jgi:tripartite-type tricarboxylate transporter receptor subunit TctC
MEKDPSHPDVPLALDYAKTEADRQALELTISPTLMARPFVAPPEVPAERVEALRAAFDATLVDPEYLADAAKSRLQVQLVKGRAVEALLKRLYATPRDVVDRVANALK